MKHVRIAALALLAIGWLAACGGGSQETGRNAEGVVESVDAAAGKVTIDHGEIPGLMGAMTMTFDVSDPAMLSGIAAGDEVNFDVRYENGSYEVTAISKK
jgi:Cu/Ag efflux protein CusF